MVLGSTIQFLVPKASHVRKKLLVFNLSLSVLTTAPLLRPPPPRRRPPPLPPRVLTVGLAAPVAVTEAEAGTDVTESVQVSVVAQEVEVVAAARIAAIATVIVEAGKRKKSTEVDKEQIVPRQVLDHDPGKNCSYECKHYVSSYSKTRFVVTNVSIFLK
jgi:hypothetical protein